MATEPKKRGVQPDGMRYYSGTGTYLDNAGNEYVAAEKGGRAGYLDYGPGKKGVPGTWKSSGEMNPMQYYRGTGTYTDGRTSGQYVRADLHGKPGFVQHRGGKAVPDTWKPVSGPEYEGTGGTIYDLATGRAKNAPMSYTPEQLVTTKTSREDGGVNTSATRPPRTDVLATPTSVEQAYSYMDPAVYGGRDFKNLNTEGFVDWSAFDKDGADKEGMDFGDFSTMSPDLLGADYKKAFDRTGAMESGVDWSDSAFEKPGAAFTRTDLPESVTEGGVVRGKPRDGLAALRQNEKDQGLVYASGAYWMDGDDGLQKITMGLTGDAGSGDIDKSNWTASRQQALNFMANRGDAGDVEGVKPAETIFGTGNSIPEGQGGLLSGQSQPTVGVSNTGPLNSADVEGQWETGKLGKSDFPVTNQRYLDRPAPLW